MKDVDVYCCLQLFLSNRFGDGHVSLRESCGTCLQHIEENLTWDEPLIEFLTEMCGCFLVFVTKAFPYVDVSHFNLDLCKEKHLPRRCISQIFNG